MNDKITFVAPVPGERSPEFTRWIEVKWHCLLTALRHGSEMIMLPEAGRDNGTTLWIPYG